ncbi:MAG: M20/M25/M40 family metallo-hydrolase [Acidobacteria bacterium]|nr:M20/M25/M40 family metallo-hydrolase [Acidobacteriota bacterium]
MPEIRRPQKKRRPRLRFLIAVAAALWIGAASPSLAAASGGDPWITLGTDAFASLRAHSTILYQGEPLPALEESAGVVLTRIHEADLEAVSQYLHETFERCSGFLYHGSLEEGRAQLRQAASRQALGGPAPYVIDQPALVQSLSDQLDAANILATITTLSTSYNNRYYQHPSGVDSATWIRDLWAGYAFGRPEVTVELVQHTGWAQPSVVMTIPGSSMADEVVVLGGHLDSIASGSSNPNFSAPGADDNASGIATLSEVARVILAQGLHPQRTLKFMGYAAEEVGLRGSQEIAADHQAGGVDVVAVLQLDMTAFNGSAQDILLITDFTNSALTTFLGELMDTYLGDLTWSTSACGYGCSDHAAWHNRGFPAAFAFEARFGQHNSRIHSTGDTTANFGGTAAHAFKFARLATAFLAELGVDAAPALFVDGFESGDTSAWTSQEP